MNIKGTIKKIASRNAVIRRALRKIGIDLRKNTKLNDDMCNIYIKDNRINIEENCLNICGRIAGGVGDNIISIGTLLNIKKNINCRTKLYIYTGRYKEVDKIFEMHEDIDIFDECYFDNDMKQYDISFFITHHIEIKHINMEKIKK